jgi:hypothetical protein
MPGEYEHSGFKNLGPSQGPPTTKFDFLKNGCSDYISLIYEDYLLK